jgi:hypothetical protein
VLEVWEHDIVNDALEQSSFDLVHARLLLEHAIAPGKQQASA